MNPTFVDPHRVLSQALSAEGRWYIYGRKGPLVFDCSGLLTWATFTAGGPDWRAWRNAQRLYTKELDGELFRGLELEPAESEDPGEPRIACYGYPSTDEPDGYHCDHVMLTVGDGRVFGACGGNRDTLTLAKAQEQNARVQYRPHVHYRPGFLGYRRFAFKLLPQSQEVPHA